MRWLLLPSLLAALMISGAAAQSSSSRPRTPQRAAALPPIAESFTYQGRLTDGLEPVNDECDLQFSLWDAEMGGNTIGPTRLFCLFIEDGLVNVELDFGPEAFNGDERWLQIEVRRPCDPMDTDPFDTLTPRQLITATPYAIRATRLAGVRDVVTAFHIARDAVDSEEIARDAVGSDEIATSAVGIDEIATDAVDSAEIRANAVRSEEIQDESITVDDLGPDSVGNSELQANAVGSAEIINNSITSNDLAEDQDSLFQVSGGVMRSNPPNIGIGENNPTALLHIDTGNTGERGLKVQINNSTKLEVNDNGSVSIGTAVDGPPDGLYVRGAVGIGVSSPEAHLHVRGQGSDPFPNADHIAIFENTGGASPDGIAIKLNTSFPDSNNNFLTFYDGAGNVRGRVEGVDAGDLLADFLALPGFGELASLSTAVAGCICSGVNCSFPNTPGEVAAFVTCVLQNAGPGGVESLCAISDYNVTGAISLDRVSILGGVLGIASSALCKYGGVTYASHGADYAEWLPKVHPEEKLVAGQVVGVKGGRITTNTEDAEQIMAISTASAVVGNTPPEGEEDKYARVGFMGQVLVWVQGEVSIGDFVVPSGKNDGIGVAVAPDALRAHHLNQIVGRAWSSSENSGLGLVNLLVGVKTNEGAQIAKRQAQRIEVLEERVESLTAQLALVENLNDRLAKLETLMAQESEVVALADMGGIHEENAQ